LQGGYSRLSPAAFEGRGRFGDRLKGADANLIAAFHAEHGHQAESNHGFSGLEGEQDFGTGLYFHIAVFLPVVNGEAMDILELAGAHAPFFFTKRLADERDRGIHAVAPQIISMRTALGHLFKLELFEWAGVFAVGLAGDNARHGEADAAGFGERANFVPDGVFDVPVIVFTEMFGVFDAEKAAIGGGD